MGVNFILFWFAWNINTKDGNKLSNTEIDQALLDEGQDSSLAQGGLYYAPLSSDNGSFEEHRVSWRDPSRSSRSYTSADRRRSSYDTDTESLDRVQQLPVA